MMDFQISNLNEIINKIVDDLLLPYAVVIILTWVFIELAGRFRGPVQRWYSVSIKENQELAAIVIAPIFACLIKVGGLGLADLAWIQVIIGSLFASILSGVLHDKIMKPVMGLLNKEKQ